MTKASCDPLNRHSVGHNVTSQSIDIQLRTDLGDLQSQLSGHLHILQPLPSVHHQILEGLVRGGPLRFNLLGALGPFVGPGQDLHSLLRRQGRANAAGQAEAIQELRP